MYSLRLLCPPEQVEEISSVLWEAGTAGIQEVDSQSGTLLIAGFETNRDRVDLLARFDQYQPEWAIEDSTDWTKYTYAAWPGRAVGERLFLAPVWCEAATPPGRVRLIHNPGLACGTGEHPCTQLGLMALETVVRQGDAVADIGTGSGILAIAARLLGAGRAVGVDPDEAALRAARENFALNGMDAELAVGSADVLEPQLFDVTIVNISGTVLLTIFEDVLRITRDHGVVIATGFTEGEVSVLLRYLPDATVNGIGDWRCLVYRAPD